MKLDGTDIAAANDLGQPIGSGQTRPAIIDPMEAFAEVPRVLPTFSTRFGLRMSYVDSAGRQRCLTLKVADLTRIMHSAATALEIVTREQTTIEKIDAAVDAIMASG